MSLHGREGGAMADDPSANREAELLALRIVETLEAAGALDVRKLNDRAWNEVCHICGGERLPVNERQARHDGAQGRNRNPNRAGMGNREGSFRKSSPGSINDFGSNSSEEG